MWRQISGEYSFILVYWFLILALLCIVDFQFLDAFNKLYICIIHQLVSLFVHERHKMKEGKTLYIYVYVYKINHG